MPETTSDATATDASTFGLPRWARLVLAGLLAFLAGVTNGNAPYPLLGYGLEGFVIYALAFTMEPWEALGAFAVGNLIGGLWLLWAQSIFTFVAIGIVVARPVELYLVQRFRRAYGDVGGALLATVVVTILALAIGVWQYGSDGTQPAMLLLEVVFLPPALLLSRIQASDADLGLRRLLGSVVVVGVLAVVISASTFLVPVGLAVGLLLLLATWWVAGHGLPGSWRPTASTAWGGTVVAAMVVALALAGSGPVVGHAVRGTFYALYPDSPGGHQWGQTNASAACRQGNVAQGETRHTGTWGPERLRVLSTCETASGTIVSITAASGPSVDGDYYFNMVPDAGSTHLVSLGSQVFENSTLHVEVVPVDQASVLGNLNLHAGDHVRVVGAWVLDTDHGWGGEIHPAWSIQILGSK